MNRRSFGTTIIVVLLALSALIPALQVNAGGGKVTICHKPPGSPENIRVLDVADPAVQTHKDHGDKVLEPGQGIESCGQSTPVPTEIPPTLTPTEPAATQTPVSTIVATGVPPTPTQVPPTPTAVPTQVPVTVTPAGDPPSVAAVTFTCNGMMADVTATVANPAAGYSVVMYIIDSDGAAVSGMAFPSLSAGTTSYSQSLAVEAWPTTEVSAVAFIGGFDDKVYSVPQLCGQA